MFWKSWICLLLLAYRNRVLRKVNHSQIKNGLLASAQSRYMLQNCCVDPSLYTCKPGKARLFCLVSDTFRSRPLRTLKTRKLKEHEENVCIAVPYLFPSGSKLGPQVLMC